MPRRGRTAFPALFMVVLLILAGCQGDDPDPIELDRGDPETGHELIQSYGCGSCHHIPGVDDADGRIAPGLQVWPNRVYVAGVLPNTPDNVVRFLQNPEEVSPNTAMPNLGVSEEEAWDITAYLFTLR